MKNILTFDDSNRMYKYKTTPKDIAQATAEYEQSFGKSNLINNKTVYDKKESRIAGILGEVVFKVLYPEAIKSISDMTYDFDYLGKKVDVKCKYRKVKPLPEYEASFFKYQSVSAFKADEYYFMSTIHSLEYVWMCGTISKDEMMNSPHMEIWRAGDVDKTNWMRFKEDTICLKYKYLNPIIVEDK